jgi:hypothetical protein
MPAKAGIQVESVRQNVLRLDSRFHGNDAGYDFAPDYRLSFWQTSRLAVLPELPAKH